MYPKSIEVIGIHVDCMTEATTIETGKEKLVEIGKESRGCCMLSGSPFHFTAISHPILASANFFTSPGTVIPLGERKSHSSIHLQLQLPTQKPLGWERQRERGIDGY